MSSIITLIAFAVMLSVANFPAEAQQPKKVPADFFDACLSSSTNTEPRYHAFDYPERTIILPGYIQEKRGVRQSANFILDTGTNRTIVDQSIARVLSLRQVGENTLVAPGGTVSKSALVELDTFCVGSYESGKVVAAVQDLTPYSKKYGTGISVILGTNFLKRFIVHIDYEGKLAAFMSKSASPSALIATIPFKLEKDLPLVEVKLPSAVETHLIIDTGHFLEILLYDDISGRLQLEEPISKRRIGGAAESHQITVGQLPWIEIATYRIHSVNIGIHPVVTPNPFNTTYKPGLLGNGILEKYIVEIDFADSAMRLYDRGKGSQ